MGIPQPENAFVPCQDLDSNDKLTFNFPSDRYTQQQVPPGPYTLTFEVSSDPGNADLTETFDVVVTLEDPCASPTVVLPEP
jgi:hypothetical protein